MMGFKLNTAFKFIGLFFVATLAACSDVGTNAGDKSVKAENFVEVWKTATCGCCADWVTHLEESGFTVKVNNVENTDSFRAALGMPQNYGSCHSAKVAGYAIEGHVPAQDIRKLLAEKPGNVVGLSVPAMPLGSPGMEHPDFPDRRAAYDVLLVGKSGDVSAFSRYDAMP